MVRRISVEYILREKGKWQRRHGGGVRSRVTTRRHGSTYKVNLEEGADRRDHIRGCLWRRSTIATQLRNCETTREAPSYNTYTTSHGCTAAAQTECQPRALLRLASGSGSPLSRPSVSSRFCALEENVHLFDVNRCVTAVNNALWPNWPITVVFGHGTRLDVVNGMLWRTCRQSVSLSRHDFCEPAHEGGSATNVQSTVLVHNTRIPYG